MELVGWLWRKVSKNVISCRFVYCICYASCITKNLTTVQRF